MSKKFIGILIVTALILSVVVISGRTLPKGNAVAEQTEAIENHIVSVTGIGSIEAIPDITYINFGVQVEDKDPKKAMDNLAEIAEKIVNTLKKSGIEEGDIKTKNLSLSPVYRWDKESGKSILDYYRASESFKVKCTIEETGKIVGKISENGANIINGISFDISNRDELKLEAIEDAMKDAKAKAEAALSESGYKITGIKTISIQTVPAPLPIYRVIPSPKEAGNATIPVEGGTLSIKATVNVVFVFD